MQCPVRNVQLWEDPEFSTVSAKATETRRVLKRVAEQREEKFCARAQRKKGQGGERRGCGRGFDPPNGARPDAPEREPEGQADEAAREDDCGHRGERTTRRRTREERGWAQ